MSGMAWDSTRPVPWRRLIREWLIYVAIMAAVVLLFMRDRSTLGIFAGLLVSGPLYLLLGYVLAKFGYQRKSWTELRSESRRSSAPPEPAAGASAPRRKPAPTRRTGGTTPEAFVLARAGTLTLCLEDGRSIPFTLDRLSGRIVVHGELPPVMRSSAR